MVGLFLWVAAAAAGAPECDAARAAEIMDEARVDVIRAPLTHPALLPALVLADPRTPPDLRESLTALCETVPHLSSSGGDRWQDTGWTALTVRITGSTAAGCAVHQRTLDVSVGMADGGDPVYRLRAAPATTVAPMADCADPASWREERPIDGANGPVRLVLQQDFREGGGFESRLLLRTAASTGWSEQVVASPAPARVVGEGDGPRYDLVEAPPQKWLVVHGDRVTDGAGCRAVGGKSRVYTPSGEAWVAHEGRTALGLLASHGLWRLASEDGWLLIVAQVDEDDAELAAIRAGRLQRATSEPLHVLESASFPGLNAGFQLITPAPFSTREEAEAARKAWPRRGRIYVKQAWTATDPCKKP